MFELKNRILIFEGIDRCGKTTQIEKLEQYLSKLGYSPHVFHHGKPFFGTKEYSTSYYIQEFYNYKILFTESEQNVILLDRSFLGEFVWALYRDYSGLESFTEILSSQVFSEWLIFYTKFFFFYDNYVSYSERDDNDSMFKTKKEFDLIVPQFQLACDIIDNEYKKRNLNKCVTRVNISQVGNEKRVFELLTQNLMS